MQTTLRKWLSFNQQLPDTRQASSFCGSIACNPPSVGYCYPILQIALLSFRELESLAQGCSNLNPGLVCHPLLCLPLAISCSPPFTGKGLPLSKNLTAILIIGLIQFTLRFLYKGTNIYWVCFTFSKGWHSLAIHMKTMIPTRTVSHLEVILTHNLWHQERGVALLPCLSGWIDGCSKLTGDKRKGKSFWKSKRPPAI